MTTSVDRPLRSLLLASVFTIATCGLIYELIAGTLASYLLGDSVTQFSTVIGVYLFAMGIGSWLSKYVQRHVATVFVRLELIIGLIGGASAFLLFWLFGHVGGFRLVLYSLITVIGTLVGLEIPLLLRLLKDDLKFEDLVSRVLSLDYIGALAASLLFPLYLVPKLGLMRSAFLFGILNVSVGLVAIYWMKDQIRWARGHACGGWLIVALLTAGFFGSERLMTWTEGAQFAGETVIHAQSSHYQRIVLTRTRDDLRLYLNGNLQFSSRDEYRYHEALVHPAMTSPEPIKRVLVMGGGDGLAVRELLRYPSVEEVVLVDLDEEMTHLFASHPLLTGQNSNALNSPKVKVINADAFTWLDQEKGQFDAVIIDFPDPSNFSLGKLFSVTFFQRLKPVLSPSAALTIQCSSPFAARKSFWCVVETMKACGYQTAPYHAFVPSFGEWGFVQAWLGSGPTRLPVAQLPENLRFLNETTYAQMFHFPPDMAALPVEINRLNNQALVRYFEQEWKDFARE